MSERPPSDPGPGKVDHDAATAQHAGVNTAPTVHDKTLHSEQTTNREPGEDESLEDKIRRKMDATGPTTQRDDPLIGREISGRFSIVRKIGAGGMGAVYQARQRGMDRDVAIKVLLKELTENDTVVRRFHIEALAVSKLRHPNTIQIFDFGQTDDGQFYIAMEYLAGPPLQTVLKDERQVSVRRALNITQQIAKSLREAHSKGIVHRDLKPDNVVLETVGEESDFVKVLDFGVAKLAEGDGKGKTLTKAGSIFGTPKYMSPEQSRGGEIDARSDVYAMGVMLYEMLLGKVPFDAENPLGILIMHIQEAAPDFLETRPDIVVPPSVQDLVFRMLEKDPERRPQTAEAVIREIDAQLKDLADLFRNVVTREDAEAAGIEVSAATRTARDTELGLGGGTTNLLDLDDRTLVPDRTQTAFPTEARRRRKWPFIMLGALVILLGGAGGIYASLDQLPQAYQSFTALSTVEVGTVPEFNLEDVMVMVMAKQGEVQVLDADGNLLDETTPFTLRRTQGAGEETYTLRKEGYEDKTISVAFGADDKVVVDLVAKPVVAPPVTARPPTTTTKPPTTTTRPPVGEARPPVVEAKPPVVEKKPPTKPVEIKKVDETKGNPYSRSGSGGSGAKSNPYAR